MAVIVPKYLFTTPVVWKSTTGVNRFGEAQSTGTNIKVRYEPYRKRGFSKGGQKVSSVGRMYCKEHVEINDVITINGVDHVVLDVIPLTDEWNKEFMREVYV